MSSMSSRKPVSNRTQKPARVPAKWRNLPAFGHGITPAMKARPIIERTPNEEIEERLFDDVCFLMPVPMTTWMLEHAAILLQGYHVLSTNSWDWACHNCQCEDAAFIQYAKRHRNGKPNYDWTRDFIVCPQCLHVSEEIFVIRDIDEAGRDIDVTVIDDAA